LDDLEPITWLWAGVPREEWLVERTQLSFDRRRSPRVDLLADLHGHLVTLDERVLVKQIGKGGMTVETTAPLSPKVEHDFRLTVGSQTVTVKTRVVHSRLSILEDSVTYLAGLEFLAPSAESLAVIGELLARHGATDAPDLTGTG
jgi:hypothetical protein